MINTIYNKGKRKIKKFLSPREFKVTLPGDDQKEFYLFNPPFNIETEIYWQGFENFDWEKQTRKVWSLVCSNSNSIFDIGANTGIFSILAKVHSPLSSVHAFEPQPNIYSVLEKNNTLNNFDILCENKALSDVSGTLPFYNYGQDPFGKGNTTAGSLNKEWRPKNQRSIEVDVITLDTYIIENDIKDIDLLKIDVETLEAEVLKGYKKHLHIHKPIVILEIQNSEIGNDIDSFFKNDGYLYFNIDESLGLVSVNKLGECQDRNYLICPTEKLDLIENIK